jgi:hypothetical protein
MSKTMLYLAEYPLFTYVGQSGTEMVYQKQQNDKHMIGINPFSQRLIILGYEEMLVSNLMMQEANT